MVIVVDLGFFVGFILLGWLVWKDGFRTLTRLVFKRKSKNGKDTSEGDHIPDNPEDRDPEDQRSSKEISVSPF